MGEESAPGLAILGAGIFARTQYIPILSKLPNASVKVIWSRSKEASQAAALLAKERFVDIEAKWGSQGLDEILEDDRIHAIAVVLAAHIQLEYVMKALKRGKHVLQEKPAGSNTAEIRAALSVYESLDVPRPIWAVAENYRFEAGLIEAAQQVKNIGELLTVQVNAELPMDGSNPYFSSTWRRDFKGGFVLDGGVHFIAGLRLITGSEVRHVSAVVRHVDPLLPPPDNVSAVFELENGCPGVLTISYSCTDRKVCWRVLGSKGTVEVKRSLQTGVHGYMVSASPSDHRFFPFCGVDKELESFVTDVCQVSFEGKSTKDVDKRSKVVEAYSDVAVIEAILNSGSNKCCRTDVEVLDGATFG